MNGKKKPEPPLIDDRGDRLVESPEPKETPVEEDVAQAEDDLNDDEGEAKDDEE